MRAVYRWASSPPVIHLIVQSKWVNPRCKWKSQVDWDSFSSSPRLRACWWGRQLIESSVSPWVPVTLRFTFTLHYSLIQNCHFSYFFSILFIYLFEYVLINLEYLIFFSFLFLFIYFFMNTPWRTKYFLLWAKCFSLLLTGHFCLWTFTLTCCVSAL